MIGFEEVVVVHHQPLTFTAAPGEWTALVTHDRGHAQEVAETLLGERPPDRGRVTLGGVDLYDTGAEGLPPLFEKVGVVSKHGRLLSNLSVGENIALPYQYRTLASAREARRAMKGVIDEVGGPMASLAEKLDWKVTALSPDERRVAELLRAMMTEPDYYLLLNVTDNLGAEESLMYIDMLKKRRRPGQGAFFLIAKEAPAILDSMDTVHTLL